MGAANLPRCDLMDDIYDRDKQAAKLHHRRIRLMTLNAPSYVVSADRGEATGAPLA